MPYDDSDMKIAPNDPSELFDSSEGAATAFMRETQNGNMEKAKQLGAQFAAELSAGDRGIVNFGVGAYDDGATLLQRSVLFAYVVNQVVEDLFPASIVAQSAMSSFYDCLRRDAPQVYERITDNAVFSQYILSVRSAPGDPNAIGKVFARLSGRENDNLFVRYGCELSNYFTMYCTQLVLRMQLIR